MIFNLYVAVVLAIAVFAIIVGTYTAVKAYRIGEKDKELNPDERYELEKDYYLVSTVGWITLISRLVAVPLFFVTVISLIPSIPGAMCEFGVFQAGSPFSWIDFGLKFITIFAFGGWLFLEHLNKKVKGQPMIGTLSRGFTLLMPLLYVDTALDLIFFGTLKPLVVPCCMVVYSPIAGVTCPFCLVTFEMPLLLIAIPSFIVAIALITWVLIAKYFTNKYNIIEESRDVFRKAMLLSVLLTVTGLITVSIQLILGPNSI